MTSVQFEYKHIGRLVTINHMYIERPFEKYLNGKKQLIINRFPTKEAKIFKEAIAWTAKPFFNNITDEDKKEKYIQITIIITARVDRFDLDNIRKPIYDALQDIAFCNDKKIRIDPAIKLIDKSLDCDYLYQIQVQYLDELELSSRINTLQEELWKKNL